MEGSMKKHTNDLLVLAGFLAAVLNTLITILLDLTVPGYNSITQYISEFGIIPGVTSTIVSLWWIINGLLLIFFSIGLNHSIDKAGLLSFLGPLLIGFYGLFDSIGSIIFPMDTAEEAFPGVMHTLVSFIGITAIIFSPVALVRRIKKDHFWTKLTRFTWITQYFFGVIYIICLMAFADICFSEIIGLLQRVFIFATDIWIAVLSCHAYKVIAKKNLTKH